MAELEARVAEVPAAPASGWRFAWVDPERGIARLERSTGRAVTLLVEGSAQEWWVTLRGRRIPVEVRSWRERMLASGAAASRAHHGRLEVRSTLPGLVVAVHAVPGGEVEEGMTLATVEAMKMQNEVRAPRAGRVAEVAVQPGQTVTAGAVLLVLD